MEFSQSKIDEVREIVKNKYLTMYPDKMERYYHILGVAKMAKYLASIYNVDESRAEICGLVHDFYKYEDNETMKTLIDSCDLEECLKYPVLFHSYASANALSNVFGINDLEMKDAIRNHVFGKTNQSKLGEIILISDYTEETRQYSDCIKVRNVLLSGNLIKAIYDSTVYTIKFIESKNIKPHPMQIEVLHEYERKLQMSKLVDVINGLKRINPESVVAYDSNLSSPFFNFIVVATVGSVRQASQALTYIKEEIEKEGFSIKSTEGFDSEWVLIDGYDFLVHIMTEDERERLSIDKLYMNLNKLDIEQYL